MSVATLVPRALSALAETRAAIEHLRDAATWSLSHAEALALLGGVEEAGRILDSVRLAVIREVDRRGAANEVGASDTSAWLRHARQIRPASAVRDVRLATALEQKWTQTGAALASGAVSLDQAQVIVRCLDDLRGVEATVVVEAEASLLEHAKVLDAQALSRLAVRLRAHLVTDGDAGLERREQAAVSTRVLSMCPDPIGGWLLRGRLDEEGGAVLLAALNPLSAPRGSADGPDLRRASQRRGEALVELAQTLLDSGSLPTDGRDRPHLTVTIGYQDLLDRLGRAQLDTGAALSAAAARRIACDARIVPVVLGGRSEPLDVGRASYVVPAAVRRALVVRDQGCAFPGCGRPAAWTDAHHVQHWSDGGETSLGNLVLLCRHHHRTVHHGGWTVRIGADGQPVFTPPPWVDPQQRPLLSWRASRDRLHEPNEARGP